MGNEELIMLVNSLKRNTSLYNLRLCDKFRPYPRGNSRVGEEGGLALLKLLVDVSSIDNTTLSNHTLIPLGGCDYGETLHPFEGVLGKAIDSVLKINCSAANRVREKVIYTLKESVRKELSSLQGIEYVNENPFSDLDSYLLPNALALAGQKKDMHSDLYRLLVATSPDLMSLIDRRAMLQVSVERNASRATDVAAQIAALTIELTNLDVRSAQMKEELSFIQSSDQQNPVAVISKTSGKKRDREEEVI